MPCAGLSHAQDLGRLAEVTASKLVFTEWLHLTICCQNSQAFQSFLHSRVYFIVPECLGEYWENTNSLKRVHDRAARRVCSGAECTYGKPGLYSTLATDK